MSTTTDEQVISEHLDLTEELTPKPGPRYTVIDFDWTAEKPLEPSVEQYATAEEVLLAGWVVD